MNLKSLVFYLACILLIPSFCLGQIKREPKNIRQAIAYLNEDCSDSLKALILKTHDEDLKELSYPWGGKYKTVFNWTSSDNSDSKLSKYLDKKGVGQHDIIVILVAFKRFLQGEKFNEKAILKPYQDIEKKWDAEDKVRFITDSLRNVYIPKDLEDAFAQINGFWPDSTRTMVKGWTEDEFTANLHHGFGMWIRNNWGLWAGSRLSKYFNYMEIYHPDDMSGIILTSYHRNLNNTDIRLEEQIAFYKDFWKKSQDEDLETTKEEFSWYKVGDTVAFKYRDGFVNNEQEEKYNDEICIAKGKITELNDKNFSIKVRIIDACDKKGIIESDNKDSWVQDPKTKNWERPKKHVIKYLKIGKEGWFYFDKWGTINN